MSTIFESKLARKCMFLNPEQSVNFIFRNGKKIEKIKACKSPLSVISPVFKVMFTAKLRKAGDIEILGADVASFNEFLQFFYSTDVNLSMELMENVIRLTERYGIKEQIVGNASTLIKTLTAENLCWGYQLGCYLDYEPLITFCEDEIRKSSQPILESALFTKLDIKILERLLTLNFSCHERIVYAGVLQWAKAKCRSSKTEINGNNLRRTLNDGNLLKMIRFSNMSLHDFASSIPHNIFSGLFTEEELQDVVLSLVSKDYQPKMFKGCDRR
ncbi:BTB/POZ domain-containing protein 3 [Pseudolycoriella hygida]|uniref:BTB/POZ domain-containing protein 3 n=1 Tax=Pseudolycoriella hygida TaxID=35572 RepID=A0A9Q0NGM7_9DIPT|nr:BTB/POZ domain-containing protein 3 [Pseudolycoriella hygida]